MDDSDILYKMKYWREYCLAKHKRKHFGRINIGDSDKIISFMCSSELINCACVAQVA